MKNLLQWAFYEILRLSREPVPLTKILSVTPFPKSQCGGCRHSGLSIASNDTLNVLSWKASKIKRWPFFYCRLWDHHHSYRVTFQTKVLFLWLFFNYMVFKNLICIKVKNIFLWTGKEMAYFPSQQHVTHVLEAHCILPVLLQCYSVPIFPAGGKPNIAVLVQEMSLLFSGHFWPST